MFITADREGEMAHENPEKKKDMVSVVLADDHARVRAGIRNILEGIRALSSSAKPVMGTRLWIWSISSNRTSWS